MRLVSGGGDERLRGFARQLERVGANLTVQSPSGEVFRCGLEPDRAVVTFRCEAAVVPIAKQDHVALAEAYLRGDIDIEGDLVEAMKATEMVSLEQTRFARLRLAADLWIRNGLRYERQAMEFHYDRPPEFFLPWLGRWRCYSHGIFERDDDLLDDAMARKMQRAIDHLGLRAGMDVLDMGGGWGCFVEYAGLQGIRVHAITVSEVQRRFVEALIGENGLPCSVERVSFRSYRPPTRFDGAVFMGTFEHFPEYERAARLLRGLLKPGARVWADFCAQRKDFTLGRFMKKYLWPGPTRYVNPYRLVEAFVRNGFNVHELRDDTRSYELTTERWGDLLEANRRDLAERFGEQAVRAFLLFLRGSTLFLARNRTQAYHLVAGLGPAPLRGTLAKPQGDV
jgi:cyclopropane-fatty-acyl-phospholipid synthase